MYSDFTENKILNISIKGISLESVNKQQTVTTYPTCPANRYNCEDQDPQTYN